MNASPRMGRGEVFSLEFLVQGGAGELEKEKSKRPIHTVELREIYIQAPKEGNLEGKSRMVDKMHHGARWYIPPQREYSKSRIMNRFKKIKRLKIGQSIQILSNPTLCGVF